MRRAFLPILAVLVLLGAAALGWWLAPAASVQNRPVAKDGGTQRFPLPEYPSWYTLPTTTTPAARSAWLAWLDLAVLAATLAAASYFALRLRRRWAMIVLAVFSLGYFGFFRGGCICPVGSIQNVAACLGAGEYLPWVVLAFFLLPLLLSLFAGRTFCAGVCPLGAIQDVVLLRPLKVPLWLEHVLGMGGWVYLAIAVLIAGAGSGWLICRLDPFVGIFRLTGPAYMLLAGAMVLLIAMFVGRPYCRYLCPYGAVLRPLAAVSWKHATITPAECINCRLCEDACPYNAILTPTPENSSAAPARGRWALAGAILLAPVLVLAGGWAGEKAQPLLTGENYAIRLADQVRLLEYVEGAQKLTRPLPLTVAGTTYALADSNGAVAVVATQAGRGGAKVWTSPPLLEAGRQRTPAFWAGAAVAGDGNTVWLLLRDRQLVQNNPQDVYDLLFVDAATGHIARRQQHQLDVNYVKFFRDSKQSAAEVRAGADRARAGLSAGAWWMGAFVGGVAGLKLVRLSVRRKREFHEIDRARCVSCGRCFQYCPVEHRRRKEQGAKGGGAPVPPPGDKDHTGAAGQEPRRADA